MPTQLHQISAGVKGDSGSNGSSGVITGNDGQDGTDGGQSRPDPVCRRLRNR